MAPATAFLPVLGTTSFLHASTPVLARRLRAPSLASPPRRRAILLASADVSAAGVKMTVAATPADATADATADADASDTPEKARVARIARQVDFWFSPRNLKRDWYLRRQMDVDGWVDAAVFLTFTKLKDLDVTLPELVAACHASTVVEVLPTAEGEVRVRRDPSAVVGLAELSAEAERSIIVTGLGELDMDGVRRLFSVYGDMTYSYLAKNVPKEVPVHAILSYGRTETAMEAVERFNAGKPDGAPEEMEIISKVLWDAQSGMKKSVVLELSGLGPDLVWRDVWDEISRAFAPSDLEMIYLLFENGETVCHVTVTDQEAADVVLRDLCVDGVLPICGSSAAVRPLVDGEELQEYWHTASMQMLERKKKKENYAMSRSGDRPGPNFRGVQFSNPAGVIVRVEGLGEDMDWQDLMGALEDFGKVVFLNFKKGSDNCHARFQDADIAASVVAQLTGDDPVTLAGAVVTACVLQGDEEDEYWNRVAARKRGTVSKAK